MTRREWQKKDFGQPWSVVRYRDGDGEATETIEGVVDRHGERVIVTDLGAYPPDLDMAQHIVDVVNQAWEDS